MKRVNLSKLVDTLKARIDEHEGLFQHSEDAVRYALIDPLLRALGWDTEDPDVVRPEYQIADRRPADYVLLANGKPTIVVESKKLDEPLRSGIAFSQGRKNCKDTRSKYFILTDGRRWELYESGKAISLIDFDLKEHETEDVCRKSVELKVGKFQAAWPPYDGWEPLTRDLITQGTYGKRPTMLKFPDGTEGALPNQAWKDLMIEPTKWLFRKRHLTRRHLPIPRSGRSSNKDSAVSTTPFHPDGRQMPSVEAVSGVYVATNYIRDHCVRNAIAIIKEAGQDPWEFRVRIDRED